jgi:hypothetical protein
MKRNDNTTNTPPINPKLLSAYMGFIGRKGAAASALVPRTHFTTEHQQRAALARWSKHNQQKQKEQSTNEKQEKIRNRKNREH